MVNFIVCEDNERMNKVVNDLIDRIMMRNKIPYKKHNFFDYDKSFEDLVKSKRANKIYILDIEAKSASGLDMARVIRKRDMDSIIIFLSSKEELIYTISKLDLMFLSFISKYDLCLEKLERTIDKALKIVGKKQALVLKDNGTLYNIPYEDILYVVRDTVDRKCVIKTEYIEFKIGKSLADIKKLLNDNFIYCHRSHIVNTKNIVTVDKKNRIITFVNKDIVDVMNEDFKKEIDKYILAEDIKC